MFRYLAAALLTFGLLATPLLAQEVEKRIFTDDLGRKVEVPVHPQRIVSMHDLDITIPLIELGAPPVASHGRMGLDGKPYLRSGLILTGFDFDNSGMSYVGSVTVDIEAVAAAKPDLIITEPGRTTSVEQLEKIAPTIVIDNTVGSAPHIYERLADLTGTKDRLAILDRRYRAQIEALKQVVARSASIIPIARSVACCGMPASIFRRSSMPSPRASVSKSAPKGCRSSTQTSSSTLTARIRAGRRPRRSKP